MMAEVTLPPAPGATASGDRRHDAGVRDTGVRDAGVRDAGMRAAVFRADGGREPGAPEGLPELGARAGRLVAIASGKGGVGKTFFTITLAQAMAQAGRQVLLLDGDLGLANVDLQLGLMPEHDLVAVLAGRVGLAEATRRHPAGFDVLAGRSGSANLCAIDGEGLSGLLDRLRAQSSWQTVLLDLAAGLERPVRRMASGADTLLVVVTDEPTSLTDAYAVLKLHAAERPEADWSAGQTRIVVNQAESLGAGEQTYASLARACETFLRRRPPLAGVVRRDERVRDAIRQQSPLLTRHPGAVAAHDVVRIAALLAG